MRTELAAGLLFAGVSSTAHAGGPLSTDHLSLGVPAEVSLVGLAVGLHPELLVRPLDPEGAFHLRFAPGFAIGPELAFLPVGLGVREVMFPRRRVRPHLGMGVQLQTFVPYGHPVVARLDLTMELGVDVRVHEEWRIGTTLSPELGLLGGFGFGMAARIGPSVRF